MDNVRLFFLDMVCGFLVQGISIILGVQAICRCRIPLRKSLMLSLLFFSTGLLLRTVLPIPMGYHTIIGLGLLTCGCIFYAHMPAAKTVLAMVCLTALITFIESVYMQMMSLFMDVSVYVPYGKETTIQYRINRCLFGMPTNILLLIVTGIGFLVMARHSKAVFLDSTGEKSNATPENDNKPSAKI